MLQINTNFKKYKIPLIAATAVLSGAFLFQYLTFIPEYSSAEEISTPVYDETKVDTRTLADIDYMQEMTSGICERTPEADTEGNNQYQLEDSRDHKKYWVAKFSEGHCWMTQNLAFDPTDKILTPLDSNVSTNKMLTQDDTWLTSNPATVFWLIPETNASDNGHGSFGVYYSWNAAVADSGLKDANKNDIAGEAKESICPKGWRLPSNNPSIAPAFGKLKLNLADVEKAPYYFVKAGNSNGIEVANKNVGGNYWTSAANSNKLAYRFDYNAYYLNQAYNNTGERYSGYSVRCVNNPAVPDIKMPEIPNPNVSVTVDKILTMKLDSNEVNIEPKNGEIMTGDFSATVSSNSDYTLSITAAEGASTSLVNQNDNIVIAEIPTITSDTSTLTPNENNWAIRLCNDTNKTNCNNYKPITPYGTTNIFLTNGTPTPSTTSLFEVGIGISPALPSGTYSTNILVTASQK